MAKSLQVDYFSSDQHKIRRNTMTKNNELIKCRLCYKHRGSVSMIDYLILNIDYFEHFFLFINHYYNALLCMRKHIGI